MLYLVHHADAVGPEVDPMRPLSERGRRDIEAIAEQAAARGARPVVIWHSGKARARQTAEALWKRCNALAKLSAARGLQPTDPTSWIMDALTGETGDVMLVGHFPNLQRLLGLLRSGDPETSAQDFPQHGMVALEDTGEGRWSEKWRLERPPQ